MLQVFPVIFPYSTESGNNFTTSECVNIQLLTYFLWSIFYRYPHQITLFVPGHCLTNLDKKEKSRVYILEELATRRPSRPQTTPNGMTGGRRLNTRDWTSSSRIIIFNYPKQIARKRVVVKTYQKLAKIGQLERV